ncbi:MAG: DnaD domain protein [Lachnospiraceae bacterium]|jgi:DnaD/phage-associated family protein|nr:DnaD domain protein [Lachnospiraceae bacterium]
MSWEFSSQFQVNGTLVSNQFIDECMAAASGEYVKVYLYLLRHQNQNPDLMAVAEALHYTEGDVKRAIAYWEKAGVLEGREQTEAGKEGQAPRGMQKQEEPVYAKDGISRLAGDEEFAQLLYIAQKYMNKVFTQRECQTFAYLYGELKLPAELLEYLVEYCVQNGHTSIRYMETVAINWHQKGMVTLEKAKSYSASFHKDAFSVMKAFGLNDRRPAASEKGFIETWFGTYGFTREVVVEACNRTIAAIHSPSFPYADKILKEWKKAGVKNLSDVEDLDMIRQKQEKERAAAKKNSRKQAGGSKNQTANKFHNFEQSHTDYDSLMMEKVRARMKE